MKQRSQGIVQRAFLADPFQEEHKIFLTSDAHKPDHGEYSPGHRSRVELGRLDSVQPT